MSTPPVEPATTAIDSLREPAHLVSPKAPRYWRIRAAITCVIEAAVLIAARWALGHFTDLPHWLLNSALVILVALSAVEVAAAPQIRYRIHRWEVSDEAIYTRRGWISREQRIAPLARVQTVDTNQGPLMRAFGLSSITVTTASSAGPITIDCLDDEVAQRVVADLTAVTARATGDGT